MSDLTNPLSSLDDWEDDVLRRYPEPAKQPEQFRDYASDAKPSVREFYRLNHRYQSFDFVQQKRSQYLRLAKVQMSIWDAMEYLNTLVDDSDPDIDLPQIEHLLQTAESIRRDGKPRWFILAGLVHDLGKILCLWDEPQWAVVGDTFPVGCRYSERIIFYDAFQDNPDWGHSEYQTELGIYREGCGLDKVLISWGHDEYMYHVAKNYLPEPALAMIRYHSCYPVHREGAYSYLMNDRDHEMMKWVREFNNYDLYTKRDERMDVQGLRPFYQSLIDEYFPNKIDW
ncbi:MAG: inositol oxygenase family protein [Pirellula sp.]